MHIVEGVSHGTWISISLRTQERIKWDDVNKWGGKVNFVAWADAVMLMKDGHVDVIFGTGPPRVGWVMELSTVRDIKILKIEKEYVDYLNGEMGTTTVTMKGGAYEGVDYDVQVPAASTVIIANKSLPEEAAYQIVKAMAAKEKDYRQFHPALADFTAEKIPKNTEFALHPGAHKAYKELGYSK